MLIWSGRGILVFLVIIAGLFLSFLLPDSIEMYGLVTTLFVAALFAWFFGRKWNNEGARYAIDEQTGERLKITSTHSLFFIPIQYWSIVMFALAISYAFQMNLIFGFLFLILALYVLFYWFRDARKNKSKASEISKSEPKKKQQPPQTKADMSWRQQTSQEPVTVAPESESKPSDSHDHSRFMPGTLSTDQNDLVTKLNFDQQLMKEISDSTGMPLQQMPAIYEETSEVNWDEKIAGICSQTSEERGLLLVQSLKSKFRSNGYLIFTFQDDEHRYFLATMKGTDEMDILRYRLTNGVNHEQESEDVLKKISEWHALYGVTIMGCAMDWVDIRFNRLPADILSFAKEVYEFCPDSIDQGVGSMPNLVEAIQDMKGIFLWWD